MAIFKCKMCGGDLNIEADINVVECEYCGTTQTVPVADNEKKISLFTRANKLRAACDFDKAAGIYESIVTEFPEEAESYWGLILCNYGIEYVDDPVTGKKIPTCHRSSFDSVLDSSDFEMVMENADVVARKVYREEAKVIEDLRKSIVEVSSKEEPYDIFICYKETDANGDRTIDSLIAQDVYNELIAKGYRVFFSRITLEDKLGQEYEPYIFAALNSAKVMLAFGTDYEYYNAVWVKNEWSRFLQLIAKGEKKALIPCYKNIDAYDMPKEFAKLQAQDMGKVGAVQDLLRGIEKIIGKQTEQKTAETVVVNKVASATVESLLKRISMFLEDEDWKSADEYCEKVLDVDPECAEAYLGKLLIEFRCQTKDKLKECENPFDNSNWYKKLLRFADNVLKNEIEGIINYINDRNTTNELREIYENAQRKKTRADSVNEYTDVAEIFDYLGDFQDSREQAAVCRKCAEEHEAKIELSIKSIDDFIKCGVEKESLTKSISDTEKSIEEAKKQTQLIFNQLKVSGTDEALARLDKLNAEFEQAENEKQGVVQDYDSKKSDFKAHDFFALKKRFEINKDIKKTHKNIKEIEKRQEDIENEQLEIKALLSKEEKIHTSIEEYSADLEKYKQLLAETNSRVVSEAKYTEYLMFLRNREYDEIVGRNISSDVLALLPEKIIMCFPLVCIAGISEEKIVSVFRSCNDKEKLYQLAMIVKKNSGWTSTVDFLVNKAIDLGYIPAIYQKGLYLHLSPNSSSAITEACSYLETAAKAEYEDAAFVFAKHMLKYIKLDEAQLQNIIKYLTVLQSKNTPLFNEKNAAEIMKRARFELDKILQEKERIRQEEARQAAIAAKKAAKEAKKYSSYSSSYDSSSCACNGSGGCY